MYGLIRRLGGDLRSVSSLAGTSQDPTALNSLRMATGTQEQQELANVSRMTLDKKSKLVSGGWLAVEVE